MSLINDALRMTGPESNQSVPPAAGSALQPATSPHSPEPQSGWLRPVLIIGAIATGGILLWTAVGGDDTQVRARTNVPAPAPVVTNETPVVTAPPAEAVTTNTPATEAARPAARAYKLQAIFVKRTSISAVINAKTVWVNDWVDDARVTAIDRESVTLVTKTGQTTRLELVY